MAPDQAPASVEEFALGIQARNPSLVKGALDAGVQPNTTIYGRHPLWVLLGTGYDELPTGLQTGMTRDEFSARTSEIVNTLFDRGVKVAEEGKYQTQTQAYLVDRFLLSDDVNDAATIVIHAVNETLQDGRPAYQPDLTRLITGLFASGSVPEQADPQAVINHLVDDVVRLQETVRTRLLEPKTPAEKAVAEAGEKALYWTQPQARPDVLRIMTELGLLAARQGELPPGAAPGELAQKFSTEARPLPEFVSVIEKKPARQILNEMKEELVGLDEIKAETKSFTFRQSYDKARADDDLAPTKTPSFNTAFTGYDGVGKSTIAHKHAELLVALDLAGPNLVEITHETVGKMAGSYTPKVMAQFFAAADIINIEMTGGSRDKEGKNLDDYIMDALQASLDGRKTPPVILLSGWREDVEAALDNCPGVKALIKNFTAVPEPSIEQLGVALDRRLAGPPDKEGKTKGIVLEQAARDYVLREFTAARKRLGSNGFRNMREVDAIAEKLPDAISERLFGSDENEQALTTAADRKAVLNTAKLEDIQAINLRKILGGPALLKAPGIGFHAAL